VRCAVCGVVSRYVAVVGIWMEHRQKEAGVCTERDSFAPYAMH
jgi:hypothetical protein